MSELEKAGLRHDINVKLRLGAELTVREESYYLCFMASHSECIEYLKRKRGIGKIRKKE